MQYNDQIVRRLYTLNHCLQKIAGFAFVSLVRPVSNAASANASGRYSQVVGCCSTGISVTKVPASDCKPVGSAFTAWRGLYEEIWYVIERIICWKTCWKHDEAQKYALIVRLSCPMRLNCSTECKLSPALYFAECTDKTWLTRNLNAITHTCSALLSSYPYTRYGSSLVWCYSERTGKSKAQKVDCWLRTVSGSCFLKK